VVELALRAVSDTDGHGPFSFNGQTVPPVIRVQPGDLLKITYINAMSPTSHESCATGPCMNMTNLHFHGLGVSPNAPQDDVLDMMAMPGETLNYAVAIPPEQPPGLYWYHTHPHGESQRQGLDGMSGAIVVEGSIGTCRRCRRSLSECSSYVVVTSSTMLRPRRCGDRSGSLTLRVAPPRKRSRRSGS
jgi:hypothetical protein